MPRFLTTWFPAAAGLAALAGVAFTAPAYAVPLVSGNFITVGDATITVTDCAGLCGNGELVAASGSTVGFVIDRLGGGTLVPVLGDITVSFEVITTGHDISSIGLSATGTGNASVGESVTDNAFPFGCTIGSGTAAVGAGTTSVTLTYPGSAGGCSDDMRDVFITKDIAGNDGSVISVLQLLVGDNVVTPAPEPSGAAALMAGLFGLFWVRRRSA